MCSIPHALVREALDAFFEDASQLSCTPASGGVNNLTQFVHAPGGGPPQHVLRVYNNGGNFAKVSFEHAVLAALGELRLSFAVPTALPCRATGLPYATLSNGSWACVFHAIPGVLARTSSPEAVGAAAGELTNALASIRLHEPPATPAYYDLYAAHHAITCRDAFFEGLAGAGLEPGELAFLSAEIGALEGALGGWHALRLPKQHIHGDLHIENVLVHQGAVSGVLDFEFAAIDWRAMELAICLSKYLSEASPLPFCASMAAGYARHVRLSEDEVRLIPDLLKLRLLNNVVFFTGRALAGEDTWEQLRARAATYVRRIRWLAANREALIAIVQAAAVDTSVAGDGGA